jgi:hypothetical protein
VGPGELDALENSQLHPVVGQFPAELAGAFHGLEPPLHSGLGPHKHLKRLSKCPQGRFSLPPIQQRASNADIYCLPGDSPFLRLCGGPACDQNQTDDQPGFHSFSRPIHNATSSVWAFLQRRPGTAESIFRLSVTFLVHNQCQNRQEEVAGRKVAQ